MTSSRIQNGHELNLKSFKRKTGKFSLEFFADMTKKNNFFSSKKKLPERSLKDSIDGLMLEIVLIAGSLMHAIF